MPRPSHLSPDNILRFLQVRNSPASADEIITGLHLKKSDRRPLYKMLSKLKKRGAITEIPGGRYRLGGRKPEGDSRPPRGEARPESRSGSATHAAKTTSNPPRAPVSQPVNARDQASGRLVLHHDGYGFVVLDTPDRQIDGDIFIPRDAIEDAMHGDHVVVKILPRGAGARAEGRILRVLDRAHPTVVGLFRYGPGSRANVVVPYDARLQQHIEIPPGQELTTGLAKKLGFSGADERSMRSRRIPHLDELDGAVVNVQLVRFPKGGLPPAGRVIEILGRPGDLGVDTEIIIRKHQLPHVFPDAVCEEAERLAQPVQEAERAHREDFRHLPIVTIDGETARDFDDAVAARRLAQGHWELQVHIVDVAHYVREGSAIDDEARLRGTSVYFPDRAVPMLPLELSTDVCSLRPQLDRPVLSCVMEIDPRCDIVGYELCEGIIRSAERMTYTDVNAVLEGDAHLRERYAPLVESFELMKELALILNRKRVRRGSIDFDLPEPVIEFDELGMMRSITRSERNIAHRLIEEFMLAANESVASYLEQKEIGSLYRIHEPPDAKRVLEFETIAARFGYSLGVGVLPVQRFTARTDRRAAYGTGRSAPQFEIPQDVRITPRMYQKLTQKLAGKPEERILSYLMLRSLKQARYSEDNVGHFALAAPSYTHFTSPIRRYPDLIVHRILKQVLQDSAEERDGEVPVGRGVPVSRPYGEELEAGRKSQERSPSHKHDRKIRRHGPQHLSGATSGAISGPLELDELHDIAEQSSQTERRADDAERELMEWKKLKFMHDRMGEEFTGLIVSVTKFGFFVELTELFVEGLVPLASLTGDRYTYRENTRQIMGERSKHAYSLGDTVRVWVDRIDRMQRKIQFAVVQEEKERGPRRKKRGKH